MWEHKEVHDLQSTGINRRHELDTEKVHYNGAWPHDYPETGLHFTDGDIYTEWGGHGNEI